MPYLVFFHSDMPEATARPLVRTLESLPLSVTRIDAASKGVAEVERRPDVPVVTLCSCPSRLEAFRALGPRAWIAVLPPCGGPESRFAEAGASAVLRLPLERSALLSAVSRCLSMSESCDARPTGDAGVAPPTAFNHAPTG